MTPQKAYKEFLLKVNKNDTNANIKIPKSQFVLIFNEQKRQWLDDKIKGKNNSDYIEDLESLLETHIPLEKVSSLAQYDNFKIPDNLFRRVSSYSVCSKDGCIERVVYNNFVKPKDINILLLNDNQNPSFEYQETLCMLNNNVLSIYKSDFIINEAYLSYYREPKDIDIVGYTHIDGEQSNDVEVDLDNFSMEEVLNRAAIEAVRNYESVEQTQLAIQRQQQNEGIIN